jgi:hypothetical protein
MNNEPVAWMNESDWMGGVELDVITDEFKQSGKGGDCSEYHIPLYTHPANQVTDSDYADAILQRDNYHAIADSLAEAIGVYFGVDIGEHSSGNNPWEFALGIIEDTHPAKTLTDDEIQDCMGFLPKYNSEIVDEDLVKFARAILRKVQQK